MGVFMRKKLFSLMGFVLICACLFVGCNSVSDSVVRIHIRANSNSQVDQEVKLLVRDEIIEYITPIIEDCNSSGDVKNMLQSELAAIENIANETLKLNGFKYLSSASIDNEFFPSRDYDGVTFPSDYYDALIVRLGEGVGDNWWCVAYPPLCFVSNDNSARLEYKSLLVELIKKYF